MAVPIVLSPEDAEDSYRSLDFLLEQLLITLRQVLILRRREAASNAPVPHTVRHRHTPSEERSIDESSESVASGPEEATRVSPEEMFNHPSLSLPDIVLESTSSQLQQQQQQQQQQTQHQNHLLNHHFQNLHHHHHHHHHQDPHQHQQQQQKEGERTINVDRSDSTGPTQNWVQVGADLRLRIADQLMATNRLDQKEEGKTNIKDDKDASLLSLFCPPLGGSVWTTVALLVGWGILSRTR